MLDKLFVVLFFIGLVAVAVVYLAAQIGAFQRSRVQDRPVA